MLEAVAAARRAAAVPRVEAESSDRVTPLARERLRGEESTDRIERTYIAGRIRARRAADRCLIDHHDAIDPFGPFERLMGSRRFGRSAEPPQQRGIEDVLHQ